MTNISYKRDTCRLCSGHNITKFLPIAASPLADAYVPESKVNSPQEVFPLDVWICEDCGHVQLRHVVDPEFIYREYLYVTNSSPGLPSYFVDYAAEVIEWGQLSEESLVIDIGSNDGSLLKAFKKNKMTVLGVDPAREIAAKATEEGIPTIPEFVSPSLAKSIREEHGPAKLVTANNIVANVDDLPEFFESIIALLDDNGIFVMESGYWLDILNNYLFDTIYHEHLSYFSILPLLKFVENTELSLVHAEHTPSKGGSLRYFFVKNKNTNASEQLSAFIENERKTGLHTVETNLAYVQRIDRCKEAVRNCLEEITSSGKTVAAYGASNTTTTLFYHFGLDDYIKYMVDDNPIKIGLYSPGLHIPVYSPDVIYDRKPDYIFIAAWRFWDLIVERHPEFTKNGGKWIIPLPQLEIK